MMRGWPLRARFWYFAHRVAIRAAWRVEMTGSSRLWRVSHWVTGKWVDAYLDYMRKVSQ